VSWRGLVLLLLYAAPPPDPWPLRGCGVWGVVVPCSLRCKERSLLLLLLLLYMPAPGQRRLYNQPVRTPVRAQTRDSERGPQSRAASQGGKGGPPVRVCRGAWQGHQRTLRRDRWRQVPPQHPQPQRWPVRWRQPRHPGSLQERGELGSAAGECVKAGAGERAPGRVVTWLPRGRSGSGGGCRRSSCGGRGGVCGTRTRSIRIF
jgi:hypothetical protein